MVPEFAPADSDSVPLFVLRPEDLADWLGNQTNNVQKWVVGAGFSGALGETVTVPSEQGEISCALFGWGSEQSRKRGRFHLAQAARKLPAGVYELVADFDQAKLMESALGWLLESYRYSQFKECPALKAQLKTPDGVDGDELQAIAKGEFLARDLINTPTNHLGPDVLETAFAQLASEFGADVTVTSGEDLLANNLPLIHAVGRAADQEPRLLNMSWGNPDDPSITLVGKGVCFDTGGLNIKPGGSMGLMKKDMGGGATVMGLAHIIMAQKLPVRLRVLIPAVENSISAGAFRPSDILTSRKGLTVEVNNTDAEGRLVLADALAVADENSPDLIICMATLTGAARVALGPDVAPFYTDDESLAETLTQAANSVCDPLWRMPFWDPYEPMIEPSIADLDNAPKGGFAGSVTAALFLRRFVENAGSFVHMDIYGWTPEAKPGRAKGGAFQGARALLETIKQMAHR